MSDPTERHEALVMYCVEHRCEDCPINDPELAGPDGECIVALAMDLLRPELKAGMIVARDDIGPKS